MTLAVDCEVDRTELGLGDLDLNDGTNYVVVRLGPGAKRRKRVSVNSDYVHGEVVVASPLQHGERLLRVRVLASSGASLFTKLMALDAAFSQSTYSVSGSLDGGSFTWDGCTPADLEPGEGGEWDKMPLHSHQQEVEILIPSNPIATFGPF